MQSAPLSKLASSCTCALLPFVIFIYLTQVVHGAGVVIIKEQAFHSDASATAIAYTKIIDNTGPLIKIIAGGKEIVVEREKCANRLDVLSWLPETISNENELAPVRTAFNEMKIFVKRYPKSTQLLQQHIDLFGKCVADFEAGKIRYNKEWITASAYTEIQTGLKKQAEDYRRKEQALAEERRKKREAEAAFAAEQRERGLELYGESWLPKEEVEKLQQRDRENAIAWEAISKKSVFGSIYSILQVGDDGMLIEIHRGSIENSGVNTSLAYLRGGVKGMAADGDFYKGDLYWSGNFTYTNRLGYEKTVNAYSLTKEEAVARVRKTLVAGKEPEPSESPTVRVEPKKSDDSNPLQHASSTGSGFFVGENGHVITNAHVVNDGQSVFVIIGNKKLKAEVVKISKIADLALLKVEQPTKGLAIATVEAEVGQDAFAIGYPQPSIQGIDVKVTKGIVSSRKGLRDDASQFQIDAAVQPGNSGGPLCDASGRVIGVVVSGLNQIAVARNTGNIPQNVNYAIKANEVAALLRSCSVNFQAADRQEDEVATNALKFAVEATCLVAIE